MEKSPKRQRKEDVENPTLFFDAVSSNYVEEVRRFLINNPGFCPNTKNDDGDSALIMAATKNYFDIVKLLLLDERTDVNVTNKNMSTPLIMATISGHEQIVRLLIANPKTNINHQNVFQCAAVHLTKKKSILEIFLNNDKCDVNLKNNYGQTSFIVCDNDESVPLFLNCPKVDVNVQDEDGNTNVMLFNSMDTFRMLVKHPRVNVWLKNNLGETCLHLYPYYTTKGSLVLERIIYDVTKGVLPKDIITMIVRMIRLFCAFETGIDSYFETLVSELGISFNDLHKMGEKKFYVILQKIVRPNQEINLF